MDHQALDVSDLSALVESGRELAAEVSLDRLLSAILERACALTDSLKGSVILHSTRRGGLYFAAATGAGSEKVVERWGEFASQQIPLSGSVAGQVFTTGRPLVVESVQSDASHFKKVDEELRSATESLICVPLTCAGQPLGVMQILNKRLGQYSARDLALLERFADQAAVAIRNARLVERLIAHMGLFALRSKSEDLHALADELNRPARLEKLTVLFADMRCFTQLCQVMNTPEDVQMLLDEFLTMLAAEVIEQDGIVNKFIGDGLLALFRRDDHARRAVLCAFRMVEQFQLMQRRWRGESNLRLDFLDIGIGIATDKMILGTIGMEGGVRDFTAIGTSVNLAAHFEQQARDGKRILADGLTYRAVQDLVEADGPVELELRKPGQTVGHPFEQYHLKRLKGPEPSVVPGVVETPPASGAHRTGVFISYSHRDGYWLEKLRQHLAPYTRKGTLTIWDDKRLQPGTRWREEIAAALADARVAVLLVTPGFLESEFIANHELAPLLRRAADNRVTIFWVAVSASSYEETEIAAYQAANNPRRPLDSLSPPEQNQVLVQICQQIKAALSGEPKLV